MKFERTEKYQQKLFEQAFMDDKRVIQDANVIINDKLKAYCRETETYLQFPRKLRNAWTDIGKQYICDVIEVINPSVTQKYSRAVTGSIRLPDSDEVVA